MISGHMRSAGQHRPLLISFSGIDGSGKSTQITMLRAILEQSGYRTVLLAFWDDVVVGTRFREGFVHKVYKSERGVGSPDRPVQRRDKNVRKWYLNLARHALYLLDALNLRRVLRSADYRGIDVIVMDRYIYDELANLPLGNKLSQRFAKWVGTRVVPQPDLALLLDADPDAARARKPEYPLDFMRECRRWYARLADLLGTLTVIPPSGVEGAHQAILAKIQTLLPLAESSQGEVELHRSA